MYANSTRTVRLYRQSMQINLSSTGQGCLQMFGIVQVMLQLRTLRENTFVNVCNRQIEVKDYTECMQRKCMHIA